MSVMMVGSSERSVCCPECRASGTLVALGERIDHRHRWLPWIRTTIRIYTCLRCGAVVEAVGDAAPEQSIASQTSLSGRHTSSYAA